MGAHLRDDGERAGDIDLLIKKYEMYDAIIFMLPRLDIVFFNGSILKVIQCYVWVAREGRPNFFI